MGDFALDDGTVGSISLGPPWIALGGAGRHENILVDVDRDGAPPGRARAGMPERTALAFLTE